MPARLYVETKYGSTEKRSRSTKNLSFTHYICRFLSYKTQYVGRAADAPTFLQGSQIWLHKGSLPNRVKLAQFGKPGA